MTYFLILTSTYESVLIALATETTVIQSDTLSKHSASKDLIPAIAALLTHHDLVLSDIQYCIVNQGPGPFTTIRTVIATANGLSFATGLPLIGINELQALFDEYTDAAYPQTVALLNAFNHEVYYCMHDQNNAMLTGCLNIDLLLQELQARYPSGIVRFIGNGAELYRDKINASFETRACIPDPLPQSSSVEQLRKLGLAQWRNQTTICTQLQPIYLKKINPL